MKILSLKKIKKTYGVQEVLRDASYDFEEGKIYLLKGRSGSGKTTLLNICSFIEDCDSGTVIFEGNEKSKMTDEEITDLRRNSIGYIFQDFNLFEDLSVYDNLYVLLNLTTKLSKKEMHERILNNLELLRLDHKLETKAKYLSGGERQRLTLARTILQKKKMIYADEPSANIDDENVAIMRDIFVQLNHEGCTILIVTHDDVFDEIADEVITLEGGMILA